MFKEKTQFFIIIFIHHKIIDAKAYKMMTTSEGIYRVSSTMCTRNLHLKIQVRYHKY